MARTNSEVQLAKSWKNYQHRPLNVRLMSVTRGRERMVYGFQRVCACGQRDIHERFGSPSIAVRDLEESVKRESTCLAFDRSRLGRIAAAAGRFGDAACNRRSLSKEPVRMPDGDTHAGQAARAIHGEHRATVSTIGTWHLRDSVVYTIERACQCGQRDVHCRTVAPGTAALDAEADVYHLPCTTTRSRIERVVATVLAR